MESPVKEYYCPECQGDKDDDLCQVCFRERFQPVVNQVENEIVNQVENEIVNQVENEVQNPVLDPVENVNNEGDMKHLIELSKIRPPMLFGLCMECDNPHNICQSYRANRILQWVEDTLRYQKERELEELYVSVNLLPFVLLDDDDDYTPDNVDDFIL